MRLCAEQAAFHKISVQLQLASQIGVVCVNAAVDNRNGHALSCGALVQLGQVPLRRSRLGGKQRIVVADGTE